MNTTAQTLKYVDAQDIERLDHMVEAKTLEALPEFRALYEAQRRETEAVDRRRWSTDAIAEAEREIDERYATRRDEAMARRKADVVRDAERRIGALRAQAKRVDSRTGPLTADEEQAERRRVLRDQAFAAEATVRAAVIGHASTPAALIAAWEDVLLTEHEPTILPIAAMLEERLSAVRQLPSVRQSQSGQADLLQLQMGLQDWRKRHPTARERIQQIEREKDARLARLRYSREQHEVFLGHRPIPPAVVSLEDGEARFGMHRIR